MDARQRRSRERLHRAALELAATRPVAAVTMTAIADEAGVHRSTAHDHADSPGGLVRAALAAELDELRVDLPRPGATPDEVDRAVSTVTRAVIDHVVRHLAVYRIGLGDDAPSYGLAGMLSRHFRESVRLLLAMSEVRLGVDVPGRPAEVVAASAGRFIADGTVGLIAEWVASGSTSAEDFLTTYIALLPEWWPRQLTATELATPASAAGE